MEKKVVKLKNRYSSEIVYAENYNEVVREEKYEFILVYHPENPNRKFLVNREAYVILDK